jgi:hypothetical protein
MAAKKAKKPIQKGKKLSNVKPLSKINNTKVTGIG